MRLFSLVIQWGDKSIHVGHRKLSREQLLAKEAAAPVLFTPFVGILNIEISDHD